MTEWPKVMVDATPVDCMLSELRSSEEILGTTQSLCDDCGYEAKRERVIPADLGRELAQALKTICDIGETRDVEVARVALARYEREVGE